MVHRLLRLLPHGELNKQSTSKLTQRLEVGPAADMTLDVFSHHIHFLYTNKLCYVLSEVSSACVEMLILL